MKKNILGKLSLVALSALVLTPLATVQANAETVTQIKPTIQQGIVAPETTSKYITYCVTQTTPTFSATYNYNNGLYSGILQKQGTYPTKTTQIYVPGQTKEVTKAVTYKTSNFPTSIAYSQDGFTGTLKVRSVMKTIDHMQTSSYSYKTATGKVVTVPGIITLVYKYVVTYTGSVSSKPHTETRTVYTQNYSGTVSINPNIRF